jgi:hypothetical protein
MILLINQTVVVTLQDKKLLNPPGSHSILIGKMTIGIPNLKNLF